MIRIAICIFIFLYGNEIFFAQHTIIPEPNDIQLKLTQSNLTKSVVVKADDAFRFEADYLKTILKSKGFVIIEKPAKKTNPTTIVLSKTMDKSFKPEHYHLDLKKGMFNLSALDGRGIFYGVQTLDQMLPNYSRGMKIKDVAIVDGPRFGWRGLMLDVSRHFFTVDEVKSFIDQMVKYKLNVFHWHLTDDNGWRIEIKSLPELTSIGAWRVQRFGKFNVRKDPEPGEAATYGGFYTQEQIKDVVRYAAERHITIVPEVDVPGHSMAMLAAYPELSTKKEQKFVNPGTKFSEWYGGGKFKMLIENTLNPTDEKVYQTLDKVFTEIAALFPGQYIHAGGDEAYHGFWEEDEGCKKFMTENNIENTNGLQSYFMKRVEKIIAGKGKKMIGWDEILEGGIAEGAAVMSWRGMNGGIEAASHGHKVVMAPTSFAYLDYTQGDHTLEFPIYANLTLKKSYEFEPIPAGIDPNMILGAQGNLWTEQIPNIGHVFYMAYPRALSIAETAWSLPEKKNWNHFVDKVEHHITEFEMDDKQICKAFRDAKVNLKKIDDKIFCELSCEVEGVNIFYTMDQTFPNSKSTLYSSPFEIPEGEIQLRVITYQDGKPYGRLLDLKWDELNKRIKNVK